MKYAHSAKLSMYYALAGLFLGEAIDKYIMPPIRKFLTSVGIKRDTKIRALIGVFLHISLSAMFALSARILARRITSPDFYAITAANGGVTFGMAIFFRQDSLKKYMDDLFDEVPWA